MPAIDDFEMPKKKLQAIAKLLVGPSDDYISLESDEQFGLNWILYDIVREIEEIEKRCREELTEAKSAPGPD